MDRISSSYIMSTSSLAPSCALYLYDLMLIIDCNSSTVVVTVLSKPTVSQNYPFLYKLPNQCFMRIFLAQKYSTTFCKIHILNQYTALQFYLLLSFKYTIIIVEVRSSTCCLLRFNLKEFCVQQNCRYISEA